MINVVCVVLGIKYAENKCAGGTRCFPVAKRGWIECAGGRGNFKGT